VSGSDIIGSARPVVILGWSNVAEEVSDEHTSIALHLTSDAYPTESAELVFAPLFYSVALSTAAMFDLEHPFKPSKVRTWAYAEREGVKPNDAEHLAGGYR
jgi:hypothetical protein